MSEPLAPSRTQEPAPGDGTHSGASRASVTGDARTALDPDAVGRLRLAIVRLARRLRQEAAGLTASQHSALANIAFLGTTTIGELAARENVQSPTMSRIVDGLAAGGWAERVPDPDDRRVTLVRATPKARRELAALRERRDAYLTLQLDQLDDADLAAVLAALPALERLLHEEQA
jgi:DNA-binding MarR family transcriptional regulator